MNKKKKTTRIKHRKNKERMKNILQASLRKAKPKKAASTPKAEAIQETKVKVVKNIAAKKTTAKKAPTKKPANNKTTTKKTPLKKTKTKKAPLKKTKTKKTTVKKD